ncbi:hypothetical protein ED352_03280 [Muribaculaceae bacterium Isolate-002 (NCI)]|nr:hypothetical protein ED352_03280 [Muribaculaceae bacterium Isolate-002 (NCI)]
MDTTSRYDRIRELIDSWYDGDTDMRVEAELCRFFSEADTDTLPDDLRQEAAVFRTVGELSAENPDKELLAEIEAETAAESRRQRHRRRRRFLIAATTVAASVAIIFIALPRSGSDSIATPATLTMVASADINVPQTADTAVTAVSVDPEPETAPAVTPQKPRCHVSPQPHRRQEAIAQAVDAEGYTIIDDPDEAARILSGAQKRYSNAVAMTEKAFVRATDVFDTAENILCATIKNC